VRRCTSLFRISADFDDLCKRDHEADTAKSRPEAVRCCLTQRLDESWHPGQRRAD